MRGGTCIPRAMGVLAVAAGLAVMHGAREVHAQAAQCKMKTSGYFKEMESVSARTVSPLESKGVLRSLTGTLGDPQKGRLVIINPDKGNCIACHRIAALSGEPSHGDLGQNLNGVATRYTEAQLRQLVINAKTFFPNTVMPGFHVTGGFERVPAAFAGKPVLSETEVEDVVAFLKTLR
jgi:sulfur-oxidizing protein SoxX